MADNREKPVRIKSPKFTARFAWLNKPNPYGRWAVTGVFDPKDPEHRAFLAQLKKLHTAAIATAQAAFKPSKKQPTLEITPCMTEDEDSPNYVVNFSEKAVVKYKDKKDGEEKSFETKPIVVDAFAQPIDVSVWKGSELIVVIDVVPFFTGNKSAGLSLRLKGAQVVKLVNGGGSGQQDAASLGFDVQDGGLGAAVAAADDGDDFLSDDSAEAPAVTKKNESADDGSFDF